jgi:hypothetical protein
MATVYGSEDVTPYSFSRATSRSTATPFVTNATPRDAATRSITNITPGGTTTRSISKATPRDTTTPGDTLTEVSAVTPFTTSTSPLDTLPNAPVLSYTTIKPLQTRLESLLSDLLEGKTYNQYLVVKNIDNLTFEELEKESNRAKLGVPGRFTYWYDYHVLIIKIPTGPHEKSHLVLGRNIMFKTLSMGMSEYALEPIGSTRFRGTSNMLTSSKEGDSAYMPSLIRRDDWPTLVIEAGYSESLTKLRADARWWIDNSHGKVKIVILIHVRPANKQLSFEKWYAEPLSSIYPNRIFTRGTPGTTLVPVLRQELTVVQNPTPQQGPIAQASPGQQVATVQPPTDPSGKIWAHYDVVGAPLTLPFNKIFLRAPVPPEQDFDISALDLAQCACSIWER